MGSHPRGASCSRHCADPGGWGVGGAALADGDCVAQSVSDGGDARVTVAPKHADALLAIPTGNAVARDAVGGVSVLIVGVAGVEVELCGVPGGVHKAFLPAAGSDIVGVPHRGDGVGERAVVEDAGLRVVTIRRTLEDGQRRHHGRAVGCAGRIARDRYSQAEIDRVIQGLLFQERAATWPPSPSPVPCPGREYRWSCFGNRCSREETCR